MAALQSWGLLLEIDSRLPSVAGIVVGGPVRGSWRTHSQSGAIAEIVGRLREHPDVAALRLVSAKTTYVHRDLWPALLATAGEKAEWQLQGIRPGAKRLLEIVNVRGECQTDRIAWTFARTPNEAARELERRLLVWGETVHNRSGRRARRLETWDSWKNRHHLTALIPMPEEGRKRLEEVVTALNTQFHAHARLPWM